jgi:hypothetical protein
VNELITKQLREYVIQNPGLHNRSLTDEQVMTMDARTLRKCFYSCPCGGLTLNEALLGELLMESLDDFFRRVDELIQARNHQCSAVVPAPVAVAVPETVSLDRHKPICDLRVIAERRALRMPPRSFREKLKSRAARQSFPTSGHA